MLALLLRDEDVAKLVTMDVAIDAMANIFRLEGEGQTGVPQRIDIAHNRGWLRFLPVVTEGVNAFGFKAMNLTKGAGVRYAIWLYDLDSGALRGILDARIVTAMRTAGTSAVATRELSRADVQRTVIIGTGAEARTHLLAMQAVRPASDITVFSRSPENRAAFVAEMSAVTGVQLTDCSSLEEAVDGADLVVLATKSPEPVLFAKHLWPGMHVNSIGSARHDQFELALDTFAEFSTIVCDSKAHVFTEAGDAIAAAERDPSYLDAAGNLAELVAKSRTGRRSADEITLYKSVGTATQDIALALRLLELAAETGLGDDLGAFPDLKSF